jgi:hypothetical protein
VLAVILAGSNLAICSRLWNGVCMGEGNHRRDAKMAQRTVEEYLRERSECEKAKDAFLVQVKQLGECAVELTNIDDVSITDHRKPGTIQRATTGHVVEARDVPTIDGLIAGLKTYQELRTRQRGTFQALESRLRDSIKPPL